MISFYEHMLLESLKDASIKWKRELQEEDELYDTIVVDEYITKFKTLRDKNQITGQEKDIGYWINKDFLTFTRFVDSVNKIYKTKKEQIKVSNDAIKIFENEQVLVVIPKTWEASKKYGANTKWCITTENDPSYWNLYIHTKGLTPYFVIIKPNVDVPNNYKKIAVMCNMEDNLQHYWDAEDNQIISQIPDMVKIFTKVGINRETFKKSYLKFNTEQPNLDFLDKIINKSWILRHIITFKEEFVDTLRNLILKKSLESIIQTKTSTLTMELAYELSDKIDMEDEEFFEILKEIWDDIKETIVRTNKIYIFK